MAFFKVTKKQEGGGPTGNVNASYIKWHITQTRSNPAGSSLQIAEFYLYLNDSKYSWHNNVSITSTMAGNANEGIDKLIDGSIFTKYCTNEWGSSQSNTCDIVISLGETITLNKNTAYSFVTANDENSRDPASWKMYASTDGISWIEIDSRDSAAVTTDRQTETGKFYMDIHGEGVVAKGSFTTGSTADYVSEINCGFQPDYVEVEMEFSTGHTLACAFLEQRDDQTTPIGRSVWDLRPIENVIYDLTLGGSSGETGICDITSTGFKYRAHGSNTLNKACTYKAVKF